MANVLNNVSPLNFFVTNPKRRGSPTQRFLPFFKQLHHTTLIPSLSNQFHLNTPFFSRLESACPSHFRKLPCISAMGELGQEAHESLSPQRRMGVLLPATETQVKIAVEALRAGEVIAVPTDTLYGLACDACAGQESLLEKSLNPGIDTVGMRIPECDFIRMVARGFGSALALTSANQSGHLSTVCIDEFTQLWQECAYIFDGGQLPVGRAGSTIIDLTRPNFYKILRPGSALTETIQILERFGFKEASLA